jgi:hypothetical protein
MKSLNKSTLALALALSLCSLASAETVGVMPNRAGGRIQLTDNTSPRCQDLGTRTGKLWQYVVSTTDDGRTAKGCWANNRTDGQIEIRWGADLNYETSLFDAASFTRTEYNARTYDSNGKPRAAAISERML